MEFTKLNNDVNGNPRYAVHFTNFISDFDEQLIKEWHLASINLLIKFPIDYYYEYAIKKAKTIGGRKYHNKQYGGGIVFSGIYNIDNLKKQIKKLYKTPINNFYK